MKPNAFITEYAIEDLDPDGEDGVYAITQDRNEALAVLYAQRHIADLMCVPEELWPIMLERTVEVYWGSWRQLDD